MYKRYIDRCQFHSTFAYVHVWDSEIHSLPYSFFFSSLHTFYLFDLTQPFVIDETSTSIVDGFAKKKVCPKVVNPFI